MSWCGKIITCAPANPHDILARLRTELEMAHQSLQIVYNQFDQVTDEELIDASSYEIKAAEIRYNWLLRRAKEAWAQRIKEG